MTSYTFELVLSTVATKSLDKQRQLKRR